MTIIEALCVMARYRDDNMAALVDNGNRLLDEAREVVREEVERLKREGTRK